MRSLKDTFLWLAERFRQIAPGPSLKALVIPKGQKCKIWISSVFRDFSLKEDELHFHEKFGDSYILCDTTHDSIWKWRDPFGADLYFPWISVPWDQRSAPRIGFWSNLDLVPSTLFGKATQQLHPDGIHVYMIIFIDQWNPAFESAAYRAHFEVFRKAPPFGDYVLDWLCWLVESRFGCSRYWETLDEEGDFTGNLEWIIFAKSHPDIFPKDELDRMPNLPCTIFTYIPDLAFLAEEICLQIAKDGYIAENIWEQMESPPEENPEAKDSGPLLPIMEEQDPTDQKEQKSLRRTSSTYGDWVLKAIEKVIQYPEAEDQDIAKMIGKDKSLLSRNKRYRLMAQRIRDMIQAQQAKRMRGIISKNRCGKSTADRVVPFQLPDEDGQLENIPETVWLSEEEDQEEENQTI